MNVLELLTNKGITAKKASGTSGGEYWSSCPGCGGTVGKDGLPSNRFHVWSEQNGGTGSYWCRQCEKHGDNIQFLIDFEGKTYPEACASLDIEMKGGDYRTPRPMSRWMDGARKEEIGNRKEENRSERQNPVPDMWAEKAKKLVDWAHEQLIKNKKQLKWLKDRGIPKESAEKFSLGWNPGKDGKDLFRPRESWGLPTEIKDGRKKKLWLPVGLVIPKTRFRVQECRHYIPHCSGFGVCRIRIRRPDEKPPRYYVIPGSDMAMMHAGESRRAYVVVESELDLVMIDAQAGDIAGCVAMGSASAKPGPYLTEMLRKSAVILLCHDSDTAGVKAKSWWERTFPQAERWPVPKGADPGEAYQAGVNIRAWILAGLPRGWFVGPSLLGSKTEGAGGVQTEVDPAVDDLPKGVRELAGLLREHPVMILNTAKRLKVCTSRKWDAQNWEVSKRISHLVYMDPEVFFYLSGHPDEKITGGNIFYE